MGEEKGIWDKSIIWGNKYESNSSHLIMRAFFSFPVVLLEAPSKYISHAFYDTIIMTSLSVKSVASHLGQGQHPGNTQVLDILNAILLE